MSEKRYRAEIERLRSSDRIKLLEVERVVAICLQEFNPRKVLDIGTGSAVFAEAFLEKGCKVAGVDVNPEMVAAAREILPQGDFRKAAAEDLPFPENSFDLVFMGHVLHETDDPVRALQEARRVTRRGMAILEWPYLKEDKGPPLDHRLKPAEVERLAKEAGFANTRMVKLKHMVLYLLK